MELLRSAYTPALTRHTLGLLYKAELMPPPLLPPRPLFLSFHASMPDEMGMVGRQCQAQGPADRRDDRGSRSTHDVSSSTVDLSKETWNVLSSGLFLLRPEKLGSRKTRRLMKLG